MRSEKRSRKFAPNHQGLKPNIHAPEDGAAEAAPYPKAFMRQLLIIEKN